MSPVIPDPDPIGLPAPVWLLKLLLVLTFVLHLLPMNLVLGGSFVAAWAAWRGRGRGAGEAPEARDHRALASVLARMLPVATAFTITLGIAPLLFLQVLYGQLFYTSSILMAWSWLAVIALLLLGYYSAYGFSFSGEKGGAGAALWALGSSVSALLIAFVFTNNMTLMLRPESWRALYAASEHGLHLNLTDATLWPRWLHFVIASFALTGLAVAVIGRLRERAQQASGDFMVATGLRVFVAATLAQMASGVWFLVSLEGRLRRHFLGGSAADTALLWTSVALAIVALLAVRRRLALGAGAIGLTVVGMALVRHRLREASVAPHFSTDALAVNPQTTLFLIFGAVLLVGLGVVAWMVVRLARPARGLQG